MGLNTQYIKQKHLGVIQDLTPEEVPPEYWTTVSNASFPDKATKRAEGYTRYASPLPDNQFPFFGGSVTGTNGINYWVWMTADKVWVTDGDTHYDITPAGGLNTTDKGRWTYTILGGLPIFNNPQNPPMWWNLDTGTPAQVLPGWPVDAVCESIRAVKYHLVALNITEGAVNYPSQVWWSEGAQAGAIPQEWIPTAENDAGDTVLGDSAGGIVDAWPLRDQLIIYKNSSTYTMQYVAGQYVYAFRKLFPSVGLQALNCACEIEGQQIVFTGEDVIAHDGQNFTSIVDGSVQRTLVESIDKDDILLCCVVPRIVERQVWVCIPVKGASNLGVAYVINVDDGLIGTQALPSVAAVVRGTVDPGGVASSDDWDQDPNGWNTDTTLWGQSVFSPTNDSLMMFAPTLALRSMYAVGIGSTADGGAITSILTRLSMRIGKGVFHSVVTQIVPLMEGQTGDILQIRMGSQNFFNEPISWLPIQDFVIGVDRAVSQIIDGRYLSIQMLITTPNDWTMNGYHLKIKEGGEY